RAERMKVRYGPASGSSLLVAFCWTSTLEPSCRAAASKPLNHALVTSLKPRGAKTKVMIFCFFAGAAALDVVDPPPPSDPQPAASATRPAAMTAAAARRRVCALNLTCSSSSGGLFTAARGHGRAPPAKAGAIRHGETTSLQRPGLRPHDQAHDPVVVLGVRGRLPHLRAAAQDDHAVGDLGDLL